MLQETIDCIYPIIWQVKESNELINIATSFINNMHSQNSINFTLKFWSKKLNTSKTTLLSNQSGPYKTSKSNLSLPFAFPLKNIDNTEKHLNPKGGRKKQSTWNARVRSNRDGVQQPAPFVFGNTRRKPITESMEIGLRIADLCLFSLVLSCTRRRGRGWRMGRRVLESQRKPCEHKEHEEKKREGMGFLKEVNERWIWRWESLDLALDAAI